MFLQGQTVIMRPTQEILEQYPGMTVTARSLIEKLQGAKFVVAEVQSQNKIYLTEINGTRDYSVSPKIVMLADVTEQRKVEI